MRDNNGTPAASPSADSMAGALEEYLAAAEAGEAPPREEFLARHPELADDLDACLAALNLIGRAAEGPRSVAAEVAGAQPPEQTPGQLGDFRLIHEVGRGGMGVVYEAEQISLCRRVALKVLPFAATMDPRQLQRFHNEARAAACLHHPHIVPVFGVGCERAVHFYAMQFIEGQTLATMIANQRQRDGRAPLPEAQPTSTHVPGQPAPATETAPRAAASTERAPRDRAYFRRMAELGIQAAEALDHAHQLGIVHRDVKPANLLVDGRGGLWVTDFGLAHMQSDARLTMTGDLVGTLRYMSPEQALAKRVVIDHRTDVYSLGATLYELLTLEPAFRGNDRQELLRQIAFEEPRPPRRVNKAFPTELETIVLKALEKNPDERYGSAKEMAADLERFLNDEPTLARRPTLWHRARKWSRRHAAAVRATAIALLIVVAAVAGTIGWAVRDRESRAAQERSDRLAREAETERAVSSTMMDADHLQSQRKIKDALARLKQAKAMLDSGASTPDLEQRVEQRLAELKLVADLEEVRLQRARGTGTEMFDNSQASDAYARLFRAFGINMETLTPEEAVKRIRASSIALEIAGILDNWSMFVKQSPLVSGEELRVRLLDVAREVDPDPWRTKLRDALKLKDVELLLSLTEVKDLPTPTAVALAVALSNKNRKDEGIKVLLAAHQRDPGDFWINFDVAIMFRDRKPPKYDEAIRFFTAAIAIRPESPVAHNLLGLSFQNKGRLEEALAEYQEAARLNPAYAMAHNNVGILYSNLLQDYDGAIACFREAIRLEPTNANAHVGLGSAFRQKNLPDKAVAAFQEAIRLKPKFEVAHIELGALLCDVLHDYEGAISEFRQAIAIQPEDAHAHYDLGIALHLNGRSQEAAAAYREAIRLNEDYAEAHCNLAHILRDQGQFAEALALERRGHELGSRNPRWPYASAQWVKECERLVELDGKLPAILSGKEQLASAAERAEYAGVCQKKRLYAAATRLFGEAIAAQRDLVASPANGVRYDAACTAALAGCGAGQDAARLTDTECAGFRKQALDWLRADLDAWCAQLDKDPEKARPEVARRMRHWLRDADFTGVRGPDALAKLPGAEREEWQKLWAEVAATLAQAQEQCTPTEKKASPQRGAKDR
jgi:serine/threonine protein kinase/Flp pilus assembly protein TadD